MATARPTTTTPRESQPPHIQNSTRSSLVNRLQFDFNNYLLNIEFESNDCLKPIPCKCDEKLSIPYGKADIPYLIKLLLKSDTLVVSKSLEALIERAHDCFKAMDMIRFNVPARLNRLTRCAEPFVRQRTCALIRVLAGQPTGKASMVRNEGLMRGLMAIAEDADYGVRFHGAAALVAMAEHRPGNEAMVGLGCVDWALDRLRAEPDFRVATALSRVVDLLTTATDRPWGDHGTAAAAVA